jgi:hypothetical protein
VPCLQEDIGFGVEELGTLTAARWNTASATARSTSAGIRTSPPDPLEAAFGGENKVGKAPTCAMRLVVENADRMTHRDERPDEGAPDESASGDEVCFSGSLSRSASTLHDAKVGLPHRHMQGKIKLPPVQ